jgi:nucleoside-diphosphate-sugar epimerase
MKILLLGSSGFIAFHLALELKRQGFFLIGVDWVPSHLQNSVLNEFHLLDLRNAKSIDLILARHQIDWIFFLAADMGGMGFIEHLDMQIILNNTQITQNVVVSILQYCRNQDKQVRLFYSSSACIYPAALQDDLEHSSLSENMAFQGLPREGKGHY